MVVLASAGGITVAAIARLVHADEDTIRQVIHLFNEIGMSSLDPQWADGCPRQISPDEEQPRPQYIGDEAITVAKRSVTPRRLTPPRTPACPLSSVPLPARGQYLGELGDQFVIDGFATDQAAVEQVSADEAGQ
ncbi:helix-turn-helix domain-containing protein [Micromonospora sp. DT201]|uniref:helix-turn-helix domain-containing protein n=1 Tax=Micromonospora sp. DT201 TaxID=3393442 RepID=UPI003CE74F02